MPFLLDPERLEAISQGVAVPGCAEEWSRCVIRSVNPLAIPARGRERMAISLFSAQACAKARDWVWGKSNGKRFIMATPQEKASLTPKPATRNRLGKIRREPVYLGDSARKSDDRAKTGDSPAAGEIRMGTRLSWRSQNQARSDQRNHSDQRSHSD